MVSTQQVWRWSHQVSFVSQSVPELYIICDSWIFSDIQTVDEWLSWCVQDLVQFTSSIMHVPNTSALCHDVDDFCCQYLMSGLFEWVLNGMNSFSLYQLKATYRWSTGEADDLLSSLTRRISSWDFLVYFGHCGQWSDLISGDDSWRVFCQSFEPIFLLFRSGWGGLWCMQWHIIQISARPATRLSNCTNKDVFCNVTLRSLATCLTSISPCSLVKQEHHSNGIIVDDCGQQTHTVVEATSSSSE